MAKFFKNDPRPRRGYAHHLIEALGLLGELGAHLLHRPGAHLFPFRQINFAVAVGVELMQQGCFIAFPFGKQFANIRLFVERVMHALRAKLAQCIDGVQRRNAVLDIAVAAEQPERAALGATARPR